MTPLRHATALVIYTTRYREGGREIERAAQTLGRELVTLRGYRASAVHVIRVESKEDVVQAIQRATANGVPLHRLYFFGHAGMYGPMFGTVAMPEQFSPYEWQQLSIPFTQDAEAVFYACRTARWFAPFFARTFGVRAGGFYGYTTFSLRPKKFVWPRGRFTNDAPLYMIACPGRKSHGYGASVRKYLGCMPVEAIRYYAPEDSEANRTYDPVATLYADVFSDIRVRRDEWRWLTRRLREDFGDRPAPRVLDIGCGNGALLRALAPQISQGFGVDASEEMIRLARDSTTDAHVSFQRVDGPRLPFSDGSVDLVISLLSFRYLDWDPIMQEIRRVLAPGGRIWVIDMVAAPVSWRDVPHVVQDLARARWHQRQNPAFGQALHRLTSAASWKNMLRYNPVRALHEYVWYFESRFPGRTVEIINYGWSHRVIAFNSGPMTRGITQPLSYP